MLDVPEEIKELFRQDGVLKNFRVSFPNGEFPDMTNTDIESESVKFTESMQSGFDLKFGLAESSSLEFTCHHSGKLLHKIIKAGIEVFIDDYIHEDSFEANYQNIIRIPTTFHAKYVNSIRVHFSQTATAGSSFYIIYDQWRLYTLLEDSDYYDIPVEGLYVYNDMVQSTAIYGFIQIQDNDSGITFKDIEIYYNELSDNDIYYRSDLNHYIYYIPYGVFQIQSSKKGSTPTIRQITAYQYDSYGITEDSTLELNAFEKAKYTIPRTYFTYYYGSDIPQPGDECSSPIVYNAVKLCCSLFNSVDIIPTHKNVEYSSHCDSHSHYYIYSEGHYSLRFTIGEKWITFKGTSPYFSPTPHPDGYFSFNESGLYKITYEREDTTFNMVYNRLERILRQEGVSDSTIKNLLDNFRFISYPSSQINYQLNTYIPATSSITRYAQSNRSETVYLCVNNPIINFDGFDYIFWEQSWSLDSGWSAYIDCSDNYVRFYIPERIISYILIDTDTQEILYDSSDHPTDNISLYLNRYWNNLSIADYVIDNTSLDIDVYEYPVTVDYPGWVDTLYSVAIPAVMEDLSISPINVKYYSEYNQYYCILPITVKGSISNIFMESSPFYNIKKTLRGYLEINLLNGFMDRKESKLKCVKLAEQLGLYPDRDIYPSSDLYPSGATCIISTSLLRSVWWDDEQIPVISKIIYNSFYQPSKNSDKNDFNGEYDIIDTSTTSYDNRDYYIYEILNNYLFSRSKPITRQHGGSQSSFQSFTWDVLTAIKYMAVNMNSMRYRRAKIVIKGSPYMEIGDTIVVMTQDDGFSTYILRRTLTGVQSLIDTIEVN